MKATMLLLLVLLASFSFALWRTNAERRIRWGLYKLRDELRWEAVQDRSLLDEQGFWMLDRSLTVFSHSLQFFSLWTLAPFLYHNRNRQVSSDALLLGESERQSFQRIFYSAGELMLKHLRVRHPIMSLVAKWCFGTDLVLKVLFSGIVRRAGSSAEAQHLADALQTNP